ncbi:hypothetical protein AVEN_93739-1, partial [Araneus ventricosus]
SVSLTTRFEITQGCFGEDFAILNHGQRTRELDNTWTETPSPNFSAVPAGGCLILDFRIKHGPGRIHGGFLVAPNFEPGIFQYRSRDYGVYSGTPGWVGRRHFSRC